MTDKDLDDLRTRRAKYMAKGMASSVEFYIKDAHGAIVVDTQGRKHIDFSGGISAMNVGHTHSKVVQAIREQAGKLIHGCFVVMPYSPAVDLAEKLCISVPGNKPKSALFLNSGAEAVENTVKIARYFTKRQAVIAFEGGFHGRTLLAMSLTSKVKPYKLGFGPFAPEIYRMPYPYCYRCPLNLTHPACSLACAERLNDFLVTHVAGEIVAALIIEPVLGEGGFVVPPPLYFNRLREICDRHGILFIADEIQTGMGRTAAMFAMEHWNVEADITTVAKSLAAGMPLSAVVGRKDIMDSVHQGGLGGTYGGNPVSCAAALAVFEIFESENLLERARIIGETVRRRFEAFRNCFEIVGDVRGLGAMMALELVKNRDTKEPATEETRALLAECREHGLVLLSAGAYGNVIRTMMPLVITDEELDEGLDIMEKALARIVNRA